VKQEKAGGDAAGVAVRGAWTQANSAGLLHKLNAVNPELDRRLVSTLEPTKYLVSTLEPIK
jgi:hypothetical protein